MIQFFQVNMHLLIASPIRWFYIEDKDDDLHFAWPPVLCICQQQEISK